MPVIANYAMSLDDMVSMDNLLDAKKRIIRDMKSDKTIDDADKYLMETSYKVEIDPTKTDELMKNITKLLKSNIDIFKQLNNRILFPRASTGAGARPSSIVRESDATVVDIFDKIDILKNNINTITDNTKLLLPLTSFISNRDFEKAYKTVGEYNEIQRDFYFKKIVDETGNRLLSVSGRTTYSADDVVNKIDDYITDYTLVFYKLWRYFIQLYNRTHKSNFKL